MNVPAMSTASGAQWAMRPAAGGVAGVAGVPGVAGTGLVGLVMTVAMPRPSGLP